jgi:catechol 2,3-dioxygenase-like lactoylglutathione lyase family enzyme
MPLTALDHFLVLTDDLGATRDFYRDALGLEVGARPELPFPGDWLYLDGTPRVHIAERAAYTAHSDRIGIPPSERAGGTGAVDHLAFGAEDYDEVLARLERAGVRAQPNEVPVGIRQLFVHDPNGVKIEINVA